MARCLTQLNYAVYFCPDCKGQLEYKYSLIQETLFDKHIDLMHRQHNAYNKARLLMEEYGWDNYLKLFSERQSSKFERLTPDVTKTLAGIIKQISKLLRTANKKNKWCALCQGSGIGKDFSRCKFCHGTGQEEVIDLSTPSQKTVEDFPVRIVKRLNTMDDLIAIDEHYKRKEENQRSKGWNW
jgi:hypothetical protein